MPLPRVVTLLGPGAPAARLPIQARTSRQLGAEALEALVDDPHDGLRERVAEALPQLEVAVQPEVPWRRIKSLVAFDMDSTLVDCEVIDELGALHGVGEEIAAVTRRAMAGELDYASSLRERVAKLAGLEWARVTARVADLPLMAGAEDVTRYLRAVGTRLAVLSGGFHVAADRVASELGFHHVHANRLEVVEGRLTGRVLDPVVTPERKAALLTEIRTEMGVAKATTVAVGDGANDLIMMKAAGFGVAFHGKPKVRAAADASIATGPLTRLLYLFGWSDLEQAALMVEGALTP
jgi:phosphoserine phosphatase